MLDRVREPVQQVAVRPRLIPVLLLKHGVIVRSQLFKVHQVIGNPMSTVERLSQWNADELVVLDISRGEGGHDLRRDDLHQQYVGDSAIDVLREIAKCCFMPLTFGGRIRSLADIEVRLAAGADKVAINTAAFDDPALVEAAARRFGVQCIVGSIDALRHDDGRYQAFVDGGRRPTGHDPPRGRGNSPHVEPAKSSSTRSIATAPAPATTATDRARCRRGRLRSWPAAASAAAPGRRGAGRFSSRSRRSRVQAAAAIRWCVSCAYPSISAAPMEFDDSGVCTGCQMAAVKAAIAPAEWTRRRELLRDLIERYRCRDGSRHDVVIAVSGGKDSYFQAHVLKHEFGLNPLLVTYDGNNWTDVGWRNMVRMREAFGVDHVIVRPSVATLKALNRLAFIVMGDMNWHAHVGIMTAPMRVAAMHRIPLVFYGEHGYLDLCGQFSMDDFPEVTYRDRLEHFARGFEWTYFEGRENLTSADLSLWKYPSDQEMFDLDLRGIFLGNYVYWEANEHIKLVCDRYGFEISDKPFDRTYRTMSNLDDMHENGVHDYLKFIKFGYGRATDHACKDIRAGLMGRGQAIELINRYDPVKPSDLARWLDYVGMTEQEFDRIADTFRDPRVWWMERGMWLRQKL